MHHDYYECQNCRTLLNPTNSVSRLLERYRQSVHESALESKFAATTYVELILRHSPSVPRSVLDIGCSDGAFLTAMADCGSATLEGVEPSESAAQIATDPRVNVNIMGFEEYETTVRFDLVTIFQTIEHLENLRATLAKVRTLCADNGRLMIVCHDRLSPTNRVLGKRSPIFDIEHLQIFTQAGLRKLLIKSGFEVQVLQRFVNRYPLSYVMRLAGIKVSSQSIATRVPVPVPAGNLAIFAQPIA